MPLQEPTARDLRSRIRVDRRAASGNAGYGVKAGAWAPLIASRAAKLTPRLGGEEIQAQRTAGVTPWDCWVRYDSQTAAIAPKDRVVNARTDEIFNVTFARDMTGRRRWILIQLVSGALEGGG